MCGGAFAWYDHWLRVCELADNCIGPQKSMAFNACGGGTGSVLACLLFRRLSIDYGKTSCPQMSTAVVEPYNIVLYVILGGAHRCACHDGQRGSLLHPLAQFLHLYSSGGFIQH